MVRIVANAYEVEDLDYEPMRNGYEIRGKLKGSPIAATGKTEIEACEAFMKRVVA